MIRVSAAASALVLSAIVASVVAEPATKPSEQPAPADSSIKASFAQLGDPNPEIRDAAFVRLLQLTRAELPELRKAVEQTTPVLPAQEAVLKTIVTQAYLSGEPYDAEKTDGFLGVMTATAPFFGDAAVERPPAGRVIIASCVPGFAGARCLRAGDMVLGIDELKGISLTSGEVFRGAIRQFGPGAHLHFQLLRDGRVRSVEAVLDQRPIQVGASIDDAEQFVLRRQAKAQDYWLHEFAPLLQRLT